MTLRKKTFGFIVLTFVSLIAALYVASQAIVFNGFAQNERKDATNAADG